MAKSSTIHEARIPGWLGNRCDPTICAEGLICRSVAARKLRGVVWPKPSISSALDTSVVRSGAMRSTPLVVSFIDHPLGALQRK